MTGQPLIQLRGLSRSYGGVHALQDVTLEIAPGEIHAICGENGAGKSTLIKLLTGIVAADRGEILVNGQPLVTGNVQTSEAAGIAVMHQESTAFPDLDAVDNLFVGRELTRFGGLLLDRAAMRQRTQELLNRLDVRLNLEIPVGELTLAQRQMVALARALSQECRLLIMDEPTASLSGRESQMLLRIIQQLRSEGVSILYVSHRLEEIFAIADRVTVLRDGHFVVTHRVQDVTSSQLIHDMVGRDVAEMHRPSRDGFVPGDAVLVVEHLSRRGVFDDVSFQVRSGEIVGLAGLVGAGRSEIARAVFGIDRYDSGRVCVAGKELRCGSVRDAMAVGTAMVPEDRQHEGLILPMNVAENISLAMLNSLTKWCLISRSRESAMVDQQMNDLAVKAPSGQVPAATLSGGNQQKLVLGKWLARKPRVLILDEPTRGVDVGAKAQVHQLIRQLATDGLATLLISSELSQLLVLCDRLLVVRNGRIVGELPGETATQAEVLSLSLPDTNDSCGISRHALASGCPLGRGPAPGG